ncbi:MAG: hypothetical protein Q7R96_02150 [Nanoarchaeota archaeon]|nr:hypothetical protein [Nanoarchaeota archaeon]
MGGGKRNYNTMRQQFRKAPKKQEAEVIIEKKEPQKEDVDELLNLWRKNKKKDK